MTHGGGCRNTPTGTKAGDTGLMIGLYAVLGFVAGMAHFASLSGNARLWVEGQRWQALSLQAVRLAVAVGLFVVVANAGVWPLALATVGFLLAQGAVVAWRRRASAKEGDPAPEDQTG